MNRLAVCAKNVDSEGILAYIRAVRHLHEITGEESLLTHLRDALHYEFTFKFCYNSPIKVPPLSIWLVKLWRKHYLGS